MMRVAGVCVVVGVAALWASCSSSSTTLEPDDYSADCSADEECVGVAFGDICDDDFCPCPTGAIHVSAREDDDRDRAAITCPPWQQVLLCRCVFTETACVEGTCVVIDPEPALSPRE